MSLYKGPQRWLITEEVPQWACRGTWAWRVPGASARGLVAQEARSITSSMSKGEEWRFIGPYPDDLDDALAAPEVPTMETWAVVSTGADGHEPVARVYVFREGAERAAAYDRGDGLLTSVQRLILPLPQPAEPVTVRGEVCDG